MISRPSALDWPTAFVIAFGGVPLVMFGIAVVFAFPAISLPILGIGGAAWVLLRRQARHDAIASRCAREYPLAAALVARPLPDLPTVPMRRARA